MQTKIPSRSSFNSLRNLTAAVMLAAAAAAPMQSASAAGAPRRPVAELRTLPAEQATPAPSATVVSEAPYSGFLQLRCNVSICTGQLPIVRATERLVMQHISCTADVSKESIFREFYVQVTDSAVTKQRSFHFLPPTYESDRLMQTVVYGLGQPITLVAGPDSMVHLGAMAMGTMSSARCAVTGVKQKLG